MQSYCGTVPSLMTSIYSSPWFHIRDFIEVDIINAACAVALLLFDVLQDLIPHTLLQFHKDFSGLQTRWHTSLAVNNNSGIWGNIRNVTNITSTAEMLLCKSRTTFFLALFYLYASVVCLTQVSTFMYKWLFKEQWRTNFYDVPFA